MNCSISIQFIYFLHDFHFPFLLFFIYVFFFTCNNFIKYFMIINIEMFVFFFSLCDVVFLSAEKCTLKMIFRLFKPFFYPAIVCLLVYMFVSMSECHLIHFTIFIHNGLLAWWRQQQPLLMMVWDGTIN